VSIRVTNAGCIPDPSSIAAGPVTFSIENDGADRVTEVEIIQDNRILGEKENLAPGMSATLTLELAAGSYTVACPGAATDKSTLTVTAATAGASGAPSRPSRRSPASTG
jgi:iron uptake system component EfeO